MKKYVMSNLVPSFFAQLEKHGLNMIPSDIVEVFHKPEQKHADMQVLPISDRIFLLKECTSLSERLTSDRIVFCEKSAGKSYPENILLNFLYFGNKLYGNTNAIDKVLLSYCLGNNIELVHVNQGYARCSTLVVKENAVITSDKSIQKALSENGADVLLIRPGSIRLDGFDYGFIGGCSGKLNDETVVFFGNVKKHPDWKQIKEFCEYYGSKIEILCENLPLTDIGGIVRIE